MYNDRPKDGKKEMKEYCFLKGQNMNKHFTHTQIDR